MNMRLNQKKEYLSKNFPWILKFIFLLFFFYLIFILVVNFELIDIIKMFIFLLIF